MDRKTHVRVLSVKYQLLPFDILEVFPAGVMHMLRTCEDGHIRYRFDNQLCLAGNNVVGYGMFSVFEDSLEYTMHCGDGYRMCGSS